MKIKVTTQCVADLPQEILKEFNIASLPFPLSIGDNDYIDGVDAKTEYIYEHFEKTGQLPKTGAPNPAVIREFFEENLKSDGGYDALIHIGISDELSAATRNAALAAEGLPVYVVDSRSLSTGIGLQALYACDLVKEGLSAEEIQKKLQARVPAVQASFVIDTLKFLYKGGRCSALAMFGANLLKLHPSLELKGGKIEATKKFRGKMKDVYLEYAEHILNTYNTPDTTRVFVTHTAMQKEDIDAVVKMLKGKFKTVYENTAGSIITCHCGKGTIGVLYYNDGNLKDNNL